MFASMQAYQNVQRRPIKAKIEACIVKFAVQKYTEYQEAKKLDSALFDAFKEARRKERMKYKDMKKVVKDQLDKYKLEDYNGNAEMMASLPRPKKLGLKKKDYDLVMKIAQEKRRLKIADTSVNCLSTEDQQVMIARLEYKSKQVSNSGCFQKRIAPSKEGFQ